MATVNVRYLVDDVNAAVAFYTTHFGFTKLSQAGSAFRPMADGERPRAGGWNRIELIVDDIAAEIERLAIAGLKPRNDVVTGPGGSQVLFLDPAGNLIELFQPAR